MFVGCELLCWVFVADCYWFVVSVVCGLLVCLRPSVVTGWLFDYGCAMIVVCADRLRVWCVACCGDFARIAAGCLYLLLIVLFYLIII